jgi:hypothetical protein
MERLPILSSSKNNRNDGIIAKTFAATSEKVNGGGILARALGKMQPTRLSYDDDDDNASIDGVPSSIVILPSLLLQEQVSEIPVLIH